MSDMTILDIWRCKDRNIPEFKVLRQMEPALGHLWVHPILLVQDVVRVLLLFWELETSAFSQTKDVLIQERSGGLTMCG